MDLAHSVKRDPVHRSVLLYRGEGKAVSRLEVDARERYRNDVALDPIIVNNRERRAPELGVPAYAIEKRANRDHVR